MMMPILIGSIVLTIIVAVLSVLTLTQGYGYKHKVDPPVNKEEDQYTYRGMNRESTEITKETESTEQ